MTAGGQVDRERLARWLDAHSVPGAGEPLGIEPIGEGASNDILLLQRGAHRFVLRRPPLPVPPGREQALRREYRVLAALRDSGVPHPRALAFCDDPSVIGTCFSVMEHVEGWSPMGRLEPPFDRDITAKRGLGYELVDAIARLARVDWRARGLERFGRPEGFHERQVDRWLAHLAPVRFREIPGLEEAAAWLRSHRPRGYAPGILHGDYQFANVLFRHGAPARLAAIVDWEMSTIGDPLLDLGWVLMAWPNPGEPAGSMGYFDYTGMPSREELTERYATASGLPVDWIDYYVVLARFKLACVLEVGYARWRRGEAGNPRMARFGEVVLDMAARAAELARSSRLPATS